MNGNKAFHDSQRAAEAASNKLAEEILRTSEVARAWFEAVTGRPVTNSK